ncbi:MAG: hypothetical protein EZS28_007686 [Streblomastix strix]|uniref:Uncharacterized protein n=1 Tax=Streblomastix strix TaxID=222440 RepID=A0A5J4WNW3_9EUKA|nr:MAG: hypothetical protein EZS28_007686 [Streblomastix strix]
MLQRKNVIRLNHLTFSGAFDGGNLGEAKCGKVQNMYDIYPSPDCGVSKNGSKYYFWWQFCISGFQRIDEEIILIIHNSQTSYRLIQEGMMPVFRIGECGFWDRLRCQIVTNYGDESCIELRLKIS